MAMHIVKVVLNSFVTSLHFIYVLISHQIFFFILIDFIVFNYSFSIRIWKILQYKIHDKRCLAINALGDFQGYSPPPPKKNTPQNNK